MQFTWTIEANAVRDPELSVTQTGRPRTWLTVAHNFGYTGTDGKWVQTSTLYLDVTCWGDLAERVANSVKKGDLLTLDLRDLVVAKNEEYVNLKATARNVGLSLRFTEAASVRTLASAVERAADKESAWEALEPEAAPF